MSGLALTPKRTNTILYCLHWAETVAFYRHLMGLPVSFENEWFLEFELNEGTYLSVADSRRASIDAVAGQGITLAWQVDELSRLHAQLSAAGAEVTPIRRRWGAWGFYCRDPEGHRLEFWNDQEAQASP